MRDIRSHVLTYYKSLYAPSGQRPRACVPILAGKDLARSLGYPPAVLESVPEELWKQFFPCGYPLSLMRPSPHDRILNLGSGAGIDALTIVLTRDIPLEVVNLDAVESVLKEGAGSLRAIMAQRTKPPALAHWICADGEQLPFVDGVFQWVVLNGVLNLFPDKTELLRDIRRVLHPAGWLVGADLCSRDKVPDYFADEPDAWAWCLSGACTESSLAAILTASGFESIEIRPTEEPDLFYSVTFSSRKPL